MPYKDPQKEKAYHKKWQRKYYQVNKEKINAGCNLWGKLNKEKRNKINRDYYHRNKEKCQLGAEKRYMKLKNKVFSSYGGKCVWCRNSNLDDLCLDHINNEGKKHAKEIGGYGVNLWRWAIKNNYPPTLQILCKKCNWTKAHLENIKNPTILFINFLKNKLLNKRL